MSLRHHKRELGGRVSISSVLGRQKPPCVHSYEYDHLQELIDEQNYHPEYDRYMRGTTRRDWLDHERSFAEGKSAIENFDPSFLEDVQCKMRLLKAPVNKKAVAREMKRKRRRVRRDHGNEVDIHDVRQGRLDRAWTATKFEEREVQGSKIVHIMINTAMSCVIKPDAAQWRTAAAMTIHDELIRMGKSVSLSACYSSFDPLREIRSNELVMMYAPFKSSEQRMSVEHIATYLSATFYRLYMAFKFCNVIPNKRVGSSYGFPADTYDVLPHSLHKKRERGQHVVVVGTCFAQNDAEELIEKVISQVRTMDAQIRGQRTDQMLVQSARRRV